MGWDKFNKQSRHLARWQDKQAPPAALLSILPETIRKEVSITLAWPTMFMVAFRLT